MQKTIKGLSVWIAISLSLAALCLLITIVPDCVIPWYRSLPYRQLIRTVALSSRIDPQLIHALIWQESRFMVNCRGTCGEIGLMQVATNAARDWARATRTAPVPITALQDPELNLRVGSWYLARAMRRWSNYDDPAPYALAEYNAGLSNARRWAQAPGGQCATGFVESITYPTTRHYVLEIMHRYRRWY